MSSSARTGVTVQTYLGLKMAVETEVNQQQENLEMPHHGVRPRCFLDIEIVGQARGRVMLELFADICPKTCENFRALCTGENGISKVSGKALHYKGAPFHRIVKNFMVQGGDFTSGDGTGGESVYGKTFPDENFELNHDRDMLLSMANRGKDTNGSQFFITTQPAPHLDGIHVVFGHVLQGQHLVKQMESQKVDSNSRPYNDVMIVNSGELVLQMKKGRKRKPSVSLSESSSSSESESSSDSESDSSESDTDSVERIRKLRKKEKKRKAKKRKEKGKKKKKKQKIRKRASDSESESDGRPKPKYHSTVRPDEIPEIPRPRFLYRGSPQRRSEERSPPRYGRARSPERVPYNTREFLSKSGRKIKGRGTIRYRTPTRSSSRERSATPPHWRREQEKLRHLDRRLRVHEEEKWVKGDKLQGSNRKGTTIISRKLRTQMAEAYGNQVDYEGDWEARKLDEKKAKKKEKKQKKKKKEKKKHSKKRRKHAAESENEASSPERQMYDEQQRRRPGPVSMSPMHTEQMREEEELEFGWEQDPGKRNWKKARSGSGSPDPREFRSRELKTNGGHASRSPSEERYREQQYERMQGVKPFKIQQRKEPTLKSGRQSRFQDRSSSSSSGYSRSRSRSPGHSDSKQEEGRMSRFERIQSMRGRPKPEGLIGVLPRGDSESPPPTHWKPGQQPWKPKRDIIRKEIERRLRNVESLKERSRSPSLPRTRSPSPEDRPRSRSRSSSRSTASIFQKKEATKKPASEDGQIQSMSESGEVEVLPADEADGNVKPKSPPALTPKSPENSNPVIPKAPLSKWETPMESDEGEIVEEPESAPRPPQPPKTPPPPKPKSPPPPKPKTPPPPKPKTPPQPAVSQVMEPTKPTKPRIEIKTSAIMLGEKPNDKNVTPTKEPVTPKPANTKSPTPNLLPGQKTGIQAPMVPRNIAVAQRVLPAKLPGLPKEPPPQKPPEPPKEPPATVEPTQKPAPPGPPLPGQLPRPASMISQRGPPRFPPNTASTTRSRSRNAWSRSRSRSTSRSPSRTPHYSPIRYTPPHLRRRRSRSRSRSYSRSYSRSPRRRHSSSPYRRSRHRSYSRSSSRSHSRSRSRSYSPHRRRSRDRYRRSVSSSSSHSDSRSRSRSDSRSYSRSSRSYSRSRSRSRGTRRRRYSSGSY